MPSAHLGKTWQKAARHTGIPAKELKKIVLILKDLNLVEEVEEENEFIHSTHLITKIRKDKLIRMACYCQLTEIPNEFLFRDRVNYLIQVSQRVPRKFGLMYIDLNKFKQINDKYGHMVGDHVLKNVAYILKHNVRKNDLVGRLHGDEFVVLFDDVGPDDHSEIHAICDKMKGLFKSIQYQGTSLNMTASFGHAFYPQDGTSMSALLEHADKNMYHEKKKKPAKVLKLETTK
jgi:diguanylate cyclase (GGDEF)-like protein